MKSAALSGEGTLQKRLLSWYRKKKRPLPWRRTQDPYKIWVSEVMLQQTQVVTVIPYYERWLKAFPTIRSFARAPLARVFKLWEGLGYYRRARMLHQAAKYVVFNLKGKIPSTAEELRKLPGIGRYSAGAIASIAFGERTPVLDGNVIRVLTRLFAIRKSVDLPSTAKQLWEIAGSLLPSNSTGDFNQALMELGALICSPQNPSCDCCPLRKLCQAHCQGKEMSFPVRSRNEKCEKITMCALVIERDGREVFLQKQPHGHWWAGLWTFPFWNTQNELKAAAGTITGLQTLGTICHGVTRFRIRLLVFRKIVKNNIPGLAKGRWVSYQELTRLALPSPHRKIVGLLLQKVPLQKAAS